MMFNTIKMVKLFLLCLAISVSVSSHAATEDSDFLSKSEVIVESSVPKASSITEPASSVIPVSSPASASKSSLTTSPTNSTATANVSGQNETKPYYSSTMNAVIWWSYPILFLLINFVGYIFLPSIKGIFVALPFYNGESHKLKNGDHANERNRQAFDFSFIFFFIVIFAGIWFFANPVVPQLNSNYILKIVKGLLLLQGLYVVIRAIAAWKTKCPKCKEPFARKLTGEDEEPIRQFDTTEKVYHDTHNYENVTKVIEEGLHHKDWFCTACGHEWRVSSKYRRTLS